LNRRAALTRFFDDGRSQLADHLERSLRPVTIGRKSYLFFGSLRGGQNAATLYSVVQSARLDHLDVNAYLADVLRQLPVMLPTDTAAIRPLLPDLWGLKTSTPRAIKYDKTPPAAAVAPTQTAAP